jgi:DNA-binding GntR family transcriptional regulator
MPVPTISEMTAPRRARHRYALPPLSRPTPLRTLPEQIADSLRQAILRGRLKSGTHLVETSIAEQMQTSRGPVRDALLLLERDGLVAKLPNRGTRVLDFSERTLREAATLRAALEEFAATLLVPRLNTEQLSRLEALVCRMELAASRGTAREFNEADYRFHDEIFESSGHRTLHEVWRGMQRRIRAFQASANWVSGNLPAVAQRHRAIVRALESRTLSSVQRTLRSHFDHLQKELNLLLAGRSVDGDRGGGNERAGSRLRLSPARSHSRGRQT